MAEQEKKMAHKPTVTKNRGQIKITFEKLASLIGLAGTSIRTIVVSQGTEIVSIFHDDPALTKSIPEGMEAPETSETDLNDASNSSKKS